MAEDPEDVWWKTVLAGVFCLGLSGFLYWYFTDFENSGDQSRRIHWIVAFMYNYLGKWVTVSIFGLIGIALVGMGLKDFKDQK